MKCDIRYKEEKKYRAKTIYLVEDVYEAVIIFKNYSFRKGIKASIVSAKMYRDKIERRRDGHFGKLSKEKCINHYFGGSCNNKADGLIVKDACGRPLNYCKKCFDEGKK